MTAVRSFYVRVYRPIAVYELEVEVHPDVIGLDDERAVHDSPAREALRQAIIRVRDGKVEPQTGHELEQEFVALIHDEESMQLTTAELLREEKKK